MAVLVAAATSVVLAGALTHPDVPSWERGLLLLFGICAATLPRAAVLAITAAVPLAFVGRAASGSPLRLTEALVVACLAGWSVRRAITSPQDPLPRDLVAPLLVLAGVIAASGVVVFAGVRAVDPGAFRTGVVASVTGEYLIARGPLQVGEQVFLQLESLALFAAAAAASRRTPISVVAFARMFVAGAAAAATLNVVRLLEIALRSGTFWRTLVSTLDSVRINIGYGDVNAAGSYFALAAVVAAGVTLSARGAWRVGAGSTVALILAAAWLTGSRAAVGAILLVVAALLLLNLRTSANRRRAVAGLAVCVALGLLFVTYFPNPVGGAGDSVAVLVRKEMALISLRMVREHPWFGIGVGQFHEASAPFLRQSRLAAYYTHENAHNNFLQVLAEIGVLGAGAVAWLLVRSVIAVRMGLHTLREREHRIALQTLVAGLLAFVATMLLGHPLLTPEVCFTFALAAGTVVGAGADASEHQPLRREPVYAAAAIVLLVLSLPIRVDRQIAGTNMDHLGWGVGRWETDPAGEKFRRMNGPAVLFVPANAGWIELPYRLSEPGPPVVLSLAYKGRPADELVVRSTTWSHYRMRIPASPGRTLYEPLNLTPRSGPATNVLLGKIINY